MAKETAELADYAASCRYEDIPPDVVERAKQCITDTIAAVIFGYDLPWSRMVVAFAAKNGAGGNSRILGPGAPRVHAPAAALANGALAHAFEMDNLTWPSTGVHPGATLLTSGLAVAQERGIGGRALITATVAGAEVMIRIGRATKHSNESRGFHAPGTTGPFGAAIACVRWTMRAARNGNQFVRAARDLGRFIGARIVYDNQLPSRAGEVARHQGVDAFAEEFTGVVCRYDNGNQRRGVSHRPGPEAG